MKTILLSVALLSTLNPQLSTLFAQGAAFTYQGRLNDGVNPANGIYDLQFTLYSAPTNGSGVISFGDQPGADLPVSNGLFTATLNWGAEPFDGGERWLEIRVRTNGSGAFTALAPRQRITATPYAIRAANFSGPVTASQLPANIARLDANQTFSGAITLSNAANVIAGDGSRLNGISSLDSPSGGPADALAVDALGRIGVGKNTSAATLHVAGRSPSFNPANLRLQSVIANGLPGLTNFIAPVNVSLVGTRAYVTCYIPGSLKIFDVSNPQQPSQLGDAVDSSARPGSPFTRLDTASGFFVTNNIAYVASENEHTVTIINVADPQNLVKLAEITDGVGGFNGLNTPTSIVVAGTNCFVLGIGDAALTVIDVSNPANPRLLKEIYDDSVVAGSPFTKLQFAYQMTLAGTRLYIACRGEHAVTVLNVADPANPQLLAEIVDSSVNPASSFTKLANANWVEVVDNVAYVAAGAFSSVGDHSLTLIDVSNPASPVLLSELTDDSLQSGSSFTKLRGAWAVRVSRHTAFVTCFADNALSVIDVSNPRQPRLLRELADGVDGFNHLSFTEGLDIQGDALYVVSDADGALNIFDLRARLGLVVEDPVGIGTATPRSELDVAGVISARGLKVDDAVTVSGNGEFSNVTARASVIVDSANLNNGAYAPGVIFGPGSGESIASRRTAGSGVFGLDFFTSFQPRLSIANYGFVGIGTRAPDAPLHVVGSNAFPHARVAAAANAPYGAFLSIDARAIAGGKEYLVFSTGGAAGEGRGKLVFQNHTDGLQIMSLTSNGSVGIGTVAPVAPLHIDGRNAEGHSLVLGGNPAAGGFTTLLAGLSAPSNGYAFLRAIRASGSAWGDLVLNDISGNVGIGVVAPSARLQVNGNILASGSICASNGVQCISDRSAKAGFEPVDAKAILEKVTALPLTTWSYKSEDANTKHLGPVAQDFRAAFGLGVDDKHIATVDADGVALAAIQGLNQKLTEELKRRDAENAELKERLTKLEELIITLNTKGN